MFNLLKIEMLKLRRTLAWRAAVWMPTALVGLIVLMHLNRYALDKWDAKVWMEVVHAAAMLWTTFLMPLYTALVAALVNGQEHRHQAWRLMFSLPIAPRQFFLAKGAMILGLCVTASVSLCSALELCAALMHLAGAPSVPDAFHQVWMMAGKALIATLPVLVIMHAIAWVSRHMLAAVGVGLLASVMLVQMAQSKYWIWNPWTYALQAVAGIPERAQFALQWSVGLALVLTLLSLSLARRQG